MGINPVESEADSEEKAGKQPAFLVARIRFNAARRLRLHEGVHLGQCASQRIGLVLAEHHCAGRGNTRDDMAISVVGHNAYQLAGLTKDQIALSVEVTHNGAHQTLMNFTYSRLRGSIRKTTRQARPSRFIINALGNLNGLAASL